MDLRDANYPPEWMFILFLANHKCIAYRCIFTQVMRCGYVVAYIASETLAWRPLRWEYVFINHPTFGAVHAFARE